MWYEKLIMILSAIGGAFVILEKITSYIQRVLEVIETFERVREKMKKGGQEEKPRRIKRKAPTSRRRRR